MIIQNTSSIIDRNLKNKEMGSVNCPDHNNHICDNLHQDHFIQESVRYSGNHLIVDFLGASKLDCLETMEVAMR
ncbi:adenosylmethionine decarboxylase, partial [Francisella tularensis subsp. holarctica]|nr:adenosylmethionine decarboxylase [Francisella tularensis subsp. holarctica]